MTARSLIVLILATVSGVSAAIGVNRITQNQGPPPPEETVPVVVTTGEVQRGATLTHAIAAQSAQPVANKVAMRPAQPGRQQP